MDTTTRAVKAAATRKANKLAQKKKRHDAGKKSWETRRFNKFVKDEKLATAKAKRQAKRSK